MQKKAIGYDGQNSNLFQKASFNELFTYALKHKLSLILDSNFANIKKVTQARL